MNQGKVVSTICVRTDVGVVRSNNEDNFIVADLAEGRSLPENSQLTKSLSDNLLLLVVSDGMGGASSGEVASELTVLSIKDALVRLSRIHPPYDRLIAAVEEANNVVWNEAQINPEMRGMGATVTAVLIESDRVFVAEVGDSRAYLIRDGKIKQVTTDQSFVSQLVSKGLLKPEDAVSHPRKNVLLQSIGVADVIKVAVDMFQLLQNDHLLICSDGLYNMLSPEEMLHYSLTLNPFEACDMMVRLARERGAPDNITVILGRFQGDGLQKSPGDGQLTRTLQNIAVYDPEQQLEKSHKRTQLLGSSSISDRYYSSGSNAKLKTAETLSAFPHSVSILSELSNLKQQLECCRHILNSKIEQVDEAATWMAANGTHFVNRVEVIEKIGEGLANLQRTQEIVEQLEKVFKY